MSRRIFVRMTVAMLWIGGLLFSWRALAAEPPPVVVGLTAEFGVQGGHAAQSIEKGIRLALDEINAAGGVLGGRKLVLETADDRGVPARGVDNYITFSFNGGAAEYPQRVRRASLLAGILRRLGFRVRQNGDAIRAEIRKYDETRFQDRLYTLGRLLLSVRALDELLHDDANVPKLIEAFFLHKHTLQIS